MILNSHVSLIQGLKNNIDSLNGIDKSELEIRGAVLIRALVDFHSPAWGIDQKDRRDARDWFLETDSSHPYSFENVCTALSLDVDYMRNWAFSGSAKELAVKELYKKNVGRFRDKRNCQKTLG